MLASRPYTLFRYSLGNPVLVSLLLVFLSYFPPTVSPLQRTFLGFPSGAFCSKIHIIVSYWSYRVILNKFSASYSSMFYLVNFYACVLLYSDDRCRFWCPLCRKTHTTLTWFWLLLPYPIWLCLFIIHISQIQTNAILNQSNPKINL